MLIISLRNHISSFYGIIELSKKMFSAKTAHYISFFFGLIFVLISFYLAFFVKGSFFYTSFALGSWLVLDFIDYKLTNKSILTFFYNHKYRHVFIWLFIVSFFACFTVDFIWGVKILKTWEWVNYSVLEFIRMYLFMNISFVLGMYELYRVMQTLLKPYVSDDNLFALRAPYKQKDLLYVNALLLGILFIITPIYFIAFNIKSYTDFLLFFPFLSITLISDAITYFTNGEPILEQLIRFNRLKILSITSTIIIAFIFTEGLNLFGREWRYLKLPFYQVQFFSVPLSVLIGWIPLVIGLISMVNMTKHLAYISSKS